MEWAPDATLGTFQVGLFLPLSTNSGPHRLGIDQLIHNSLQGHDKELTFPCFALC
jgi:hypothetical protein